MVKNSTFLWTYYIHIILGVWLIASPATFDYRSDVLSFSDWICGALLILLGWWGRRNAYWNWAILLIGIWLQAAPLIFWAPTVGSYLNNTLAGVFVIALSFLVVDAPGPEPDSGPALPPGWSYNPSSWAQRLPIAALALLCWMVSRYLAAYQLGFIPEVWDPFFGSGTKDVLTSTVSKAFPVSDAGLGAFAYTFEFITTCQGGVRRWRTSPWMVLIFGILVIPVSLTSVILIILQPLVVGHWCTLCLVTAVLMLIGIPWAVDEVALVYQLMKKTPTGLRFKLFFKGGDCIGATEDYRSPPMDSSFKVLWKASLWGMTFPISLLLSIVIGLSFMVAPRMFSFPSMIADLDLILGAFAVVVSVVSFAEHTRVFRWMNSFFAFLLLVLLFTDWENLDAWMKLFQGLFGALLGFLAIFKGKFKEKARLL